MHISCIGFSHATTPICYKRNGQFTVGVIFNVNVFYEVLGENVWRYVYYSLTLLVYFW